MYSEPISDSSLSPRNPPTSPTSSDDQRPSAEVPPPPGLPRTVSDYLHYKLLLWRPGTPLLYFDLCSGPTHHPLLHRLPDYPEPYSISYIGIHYCGTRNTFPLISEFDLHSWPAHLPHVVPPPPILRTLLEFLLLETRVTFVNPRNPPTSLPQRLR